MVNWHYGMLTLYNSEKDRERETESDANKLAQNPMRIGVDVSVSTQFCSTHFLSISELVPVLKSVSTHINNGFNFSAFFDNKPRSYNYIKFDLIFMFLAETFSQGHKEIRWNQVDNYDPNLHPSDVHRPWSLQPCAHSPMNTEKNNFE